MIKTYDDLYKAGYHLWNDDYREPYENHVGPMLMKQGDDGAWTSAMIIEDKHLNALNAVHGGALMSFADFSLFVFARDCFKGDFRAVTVSMNSEFLSGADVGDLLEGRGRVNRETRSLIFSSGGLFVGDKQVLSFSGVIKKL